MLLLESRLGPSFEYDSGGLNELFVRRGSYSAFLDKYQHCRKVMNVDFFFAPFGRM